MAIEIKFPVYDREQDGDVFVWILQASQDFRLIKQRQRYVELEKAAAKSEGMDKARVEDKKWEALNARK